MKLQTKELKAFRQAATIRQSNQLPILSYLKFDNGEITKNNLEAFVTMEATFEGKCLIDEVILMSFLENSNCDEIEVTIKENSIILDNGVRKMTSPTESVENFPVIIEPTGDQFELYAEILNDIKTAGNFTADLQFMPYTNCVHVGNEIIGASNNYIAYIKKCKKLPDIVIEKQAIDVLKKLTIATFSQTDNYQFFQSGNFTYGFIKKDTQYVNMSKWANIPNGEKATMSKNQLINFCDNCISACQGRPVTALISGNQLSFNDSAYGVSSKETLPASFEDFGFNPSYMTKLLKSVPDTNLTFIKDTNKYYITGDSGFVSLIMEMKL